MMTKLGLEFPSIIDNESGAKECIHTVCCSYSALGRKCLFAKAKKISISEFVVRRA